MAKGRADKVVVVDDVRDHAATTSAAVATEYRGMTVAEISRLRRQLRAAGAEYKVLKNTLVRRAVAGTKVESLSEFLEGPVAIAWVKDDISGVAKVLREFAKDVPTLVIKGGVLNGRALNKRDLAALAELPSRDVLLSQLGGLLASPLRQMAGLLRAVPQNFAYGLSALLDQRGGAPATAAVSAAPPESEVAPAPVAEATADEEPEVASAPEAEVETVADTPGDATPES
jgi:large subunit ribosomal protein L10